MPVISTGLSEASIRGEFFNRFDATPTHWPDLTTRIASTSDEERYRFLGTVPQMREWGTGRLAKGLRSESYSVANLKYEATLEVDREEIEDDQLGQIRLRIGELAERAATHKDYLIEQLLINGESVGFHSYDGVPFFNDAHVSGLSGSQSNLLTYVASDADAPTVPEFRGSVAQAIATMVGYRDDQGEPMRIRPDPQGFVCVVPPSMMFVALEALNLTLAPTAGGLYQANVLVNAAKTIAYPGLLDASKWYLCQTAVPVRPFIFQDRVPLEFTALEQDTDSGFKRDIFLYGVRARYRITYGYWQYAIRTDFTQSE